MARGSLSPRASPIRGQPASRVASITARSLEPRPIPHTAHACILQKITHETTWSSPSSAMSGKICHFFQTRAGEGVAACGRSVRSWKDMQ
eukprot:7314228-Prymnesium_polylepis.1